MQLPAEIKVYGKWFQTSDTHSGYLQRHHPYAYRVYLTKLLGSFPKVKRHPLVVVQPPDGCLASSVSLRKASVPWAWHQS